MDVLLQQRRSELGAFLRQRRTALHPADIGLPALGRRHVKGLRREELASVVGISPSWYALLEQGRAETVTVRTLAAIAETMRLTRFEREHLFALGGNAYSDVVDTAQPPPPPQLIEFIRTLERAPSQLHTEHFDLISWNSLANDYLYIEDQGSNPNLLRLMLTEPRVRGHFVSPDWEGTLRFMIGHFRLLYARCAGIGFDPIIEELGAYPLFTKLWRERFITGTPPAPFVLDHPRLGLIDMSILALGMTDGPGYTAIIGTNVPHVKVENA